MLLWFKHVSIVFKQWVKTVFSYMKKVTVSSSLYTDIFTKSVPIAHFVYLHQPFNLSQAEGKLASFVEYLIVAV